MGSTQKGEVRDQIAEVSAGCGCGLATAPTPCHDLGVKILSLGVIALALASPGHESALGEGQR